MLKPAPYPLSWPSDAPRAAHRLAEGMRQGRGMPHAVAALQDALRMLGEESGLPVADVVVSSNVTLTCARPDDPGVAVWFRWGGALHCVAVDRYAVPEANVRAAYVVIDCRLQEMRVAGLEVARVALSAFRYLRLAAPAGWRDVLGVSPQAGMDAVNAAYKRRARALHPDQKDGDAEAMAALNEAREQARREIGS